MAVQATILDRINMLEDRVNYLERGAAVGITGTDQTIKGSHDRLDALLGAGVTPVGDVSYRRFAVFTKTGINDNAETAIFTVTTTNETGSNDGGGFVCDCSCLIGHAITSTTTNSAIVWDHCVFQRINIADGTDYGDIGEITEGGATESSGATRGIVSVSPTITLTSNYVTTFNLTVDLDGSSVSTAQAVVRVEMLWWGYNTAPVLAAA